jgi:dTDP-4-dehydrorhamnose 3,5-epimerase
MEIERLAIDGLLMVTPRRFEDDRGFFMERYNKAAFDAAAGAAIDFVQDNHSRSAKGVLRGLHYQLPPHAQGKLVSALSGAVFDVAVDIRRSSPRFGHWVGVELSAENRRQLWIPAGFAHGFLALSDGAELHYKTTDFYAPECDRSIAWDDKEIAIDWPLETAPILSDKDRAAPALAAADLFD